jgi:aryl-alcohol dehydrogenase-like predicted oxidoreductase
MIRPDRFRTLGKSGLLVSPLGIGTNRWALGRNDESVGKAWQESLDAGLNFIDTAEIYEGGRSERLVGVCARNRAQPVLLASKFAPLPWRLSEKQFQNALEASLKRLNWPAIDLYYVHFPFTPVRIETLMDWMAHAKAAGKIRAIGVSNFSAAQMRRAAARLSTHGFPLAANQVHYSLLHRLPEKNGVLAACRELDVALVAYRPFDGGRIGPDSSASAIARLKELAQKHRRTPNQVALNWLLRKDDHLIAIPGTTRALHAIENLESLDFELTEEEWNSLDRV